MKIKLGDVLLTPTIRMSIENEKFMLNDEEIRNEDNTSISNSQFDSEVKKNISKFIGRGYSNIVLLSGAGTSVTGVPEKLLGKTMKEMSRIINDYLNSNTDMYLTLEEVSYHSKYMPDNYIFDNLNLEEFISQMLKAKEFIIEDKIEKYNRTIEIIQKKIVENTSYSFDSNILKHDSLINILIKKVIPPNKLTIATTNYDVLFEEAADSINCNIIDGFTHSINPKFDSDYFNWSFVKPIPNISTKEFEYKRKVINLIKLHGSITWEREENNTISRKNKSDITNPVLVFPNANKFMESYSSPYFELFTKFQEVINKPNTLLITSGFSFYDLHLTSMLKRAILNNYGLVTIVSDVVLFKDNSGWKEMEDLLLSRHNIAFLKSSFNDLCIYLEEI